MVGLLIKQVTVKPLRGRIRRVPECARWFSNSIIHPFRRGATVLFLACLQHVRMNRQRRHGGPTTDSNNPPASPAKLRRDPRRYDVRCRDLLPGAPRPQRQGHATPNFWSEIERSRAGTGFDWRLTFGRKNSPLPFVGRTIRLEVTGTMNPDESIAARLTRKRIQLAAGAGSGPSMIALVDFTLPKLTIVDVP